MIFRWRAGLALRRPQSLQFRPRKHQVRTEHQSSRPSEINQSKSANSQNVTQAKPSEAAETITPTPEAASKTIPTPTHIWVDSLTAPVRAYTRAHKKHPYVVQLFSSLIIYLLGDLSAQNMTRGKDDPYDPMRTVRALIIGGLAAIPGYNWFLWLANSFNYSSKIFSLVVKVVVNQVFFTPIFNTYFFGMQSLLTGGGFSDIIERIKNTVPRSWINSWKVWPAVTAFSFTFVPLHFRSLFAGVIAIGWQTYLSFLNQRAAKAEQEGVNI